jgi:tetratricopeptide (TPR) repeat protein
LFTNTYALERRRPKLRRSVTLPCVATVLLVLLASASSSEVAPEEIPSDVLALEKQGQLDAALALLGRKGPTLAKSPHAANLRLGLQALAAATVYRKHQEWEAGKRVLDAAKAKQEPLRDIWILLALEHEQASFRKEQRSLADSDARAFVERAAALAAAGRYDEALALYRDVADRKSDDLSPALIQQARLGRAEAEAGKARAATPTFRRTLLEAMTKALQTFLQGILLFLGGALVLWGLLSMPRFLPARDETAIRVEDLTVPPSDREAMSRELTREVARGLQGKSLGAAGASLDEVEDVDAPGFGNIAVVVQELVGLEDLVQDATPLSVGPFSMSPRQLLTYFRNALRRRSKYTLSGALWRRGDVTGVLIQRLGSDGQAIAGDLWETSAEGVAARSSVVRDVSTQVAFFLGSSRITASWHSFRQHQRAMDVLAAAPPTQDLETRLDEALDLLESSVRHDPGNCVSRFNFARVLRKLGRNSEAERHFELVDRMVSTDTPTQPQLLRSFLQQHPEFALVVRYNRAVALSKVGTWRSVKSAERLLTACSEQLTSTPLDDGSRTRLAMLVRSALITVSGWQAETLWDREDNDKARARARTQLSDIEAQARQLEQEPNTSDLKAHAFATAIAYNAFGRLATLLGDYHKASNALSTALTLMPDLVDLQINLAELERLRKSDDDWPRRAEAHLRRAVKMSPSNQKAHYLLGRLLAHGGPDLRGKAGAHLKAAPSHAWAFFELAQLTVEDDLDGALAYLRHSLAMDPRRNYRLELLVQYLLRGFRKLEPDHLPSVEQLKEAQRRIEELRLRGESKHLRERGEILHLELLKLEESWKPKPQSDPPVVKTGGHAC